MPLPKQGLDLLEAKDWPELAVQLGLAGHHQERSPFALEGRSEQCWALEGHLILIASLSRHLISSRALFVVKARLLSRKALLYLRHHGWIEHSRPALIFGQVNLGEGLVNDLLFPALPLHLRIKQGPVVVGRGAWSFGDWV
jgi:hypothetical protein